MSRMLGVKGRVTAVLGALLVLAGAGCAKQMAVPNLPAATVPPVSPAPPAATVPPVSPAPPAKTAPAPAVPKAPAAPAPSPPAAAPRPAPEKPPPVLSPQVGVAEESRLTSEARALIEGAQNVVRQIDQRKLAPPQIETFSTIQSFLAKAKEAMTAKDYQRALTLADKAQVLAAELSQSLR